ncbi:MAG TPA: RluA family pseudouridine synthase [Cyclobacteriaceae bacterium]|nr:RluA family pseudouridine synthase [Cytophagales bacterium]HRE66660.1 RluA family pseudouridine synthase [Cyclobacteriaceae bacterium]HRF35440.1 RluA family pseudouridine synthase [Cyclobacteriaceae bacterium]
MLKFRFEDAILYENSDFILINKPPFLSTLEDRQDPVNILTLARAYEPEAQVCHRLDKDTSGVLAIARHPEAYRHLSMQFENREVTKIYHAVVDGIHNFSDQLVDAPILKQNDGTAKISRAGKDAQTYFSTLQAFKAHTLVECRPVTGRMHQIRVHLARLGASITGDSLYGGKPFFVSEVKRGFNLKKLTDEEPLLKRMALHAQTLQFLLLNNENCSIEAPYPKDFQALIRQLSSNKR